MRVHDSQACRKMDVTRERICRVLELREILLSIQTGFSLVNAAVACAILCYSVLQGSDIDGPEFFRWRGFHCISNEMVTADLAGM